MKITCECEKKVRELERQLTEFADAIKGHQETVHGTAEEEWNAQADMNYASGYIKGALDLIEGSGCKLSSKLLEIRRISEDVKTMTYSEFGY